MRDIHGIKARRKTTTTFAPIFTRSARTNSATLLPADACRRRSPRPSGSLALLVVVTPTLRHPWFRTGARVPGLRVAVGLSKLSARTRYIVSTRPLLLGHPAAAGVVPLSMRATWAAGSGDSSRCAASAKAGSRARLGSRLAPCFESLKLVFDPSSDKTLLRAKVLYNRSSYDLSPKYRIAEAP